MRRNRVLAAASLGVLGLVAVGGCANPSASTGSPAQAPPLGAGMARIWVLRQADPPQGNLEAASPIVFANGAPLADSKEGTVFLRFPAGHLQAGCPGLWNACQAERHRPALGGHAKLCSDRDDPQLGRRRVGGWNFDVLSMSPEVAQQYLPTLAYLGQR